MEKFINLLDKFFARLISILMVTSIVAGIVFFPYLLGDAMINPGYFDTTILLFVFLGKWLVGLLGIFGFFLLSVFTYSALKNTPDIYFRLERKVFEYIKRKCLCFQVWHNDKKIKRKLKKLQKTNKKRNKKIRAKRRKEKSSKPKLFKIKWTKELKIEEQRFIEEIQNKKEK